MRDARYCELQEAIKNKTTDDLYNEEFFFHSQPCRVEFQRTQANQLRSKQVIDKRNPEIQIRLKSCSHRQEVQETYECTIAPHESVSRLDVSSSDLSQLEHEKEVELRNVRSIILKTDYSTDNPDSSLKEVILTEIIEGLKAELSAGRAIILNNLAEIYKAWMMEHWMDDPRTDKALHIEFQHLVTKHICNKMDFGQNRCQRIYTKDVKAFALKYAEENYSRSSNEEIAILKKASTIFREKILKFMKDNPLKSKDFRVAFGENQQFISVSKSQCHRKS